MPHIIVEHSDHLTKIIRENALLGHLHEVVCETGLFQPEAVKARSLSFEHFVLTGDAMSFMHITIAILTGRTSEERKQLSQQVFDTVARMVPGINKLSVDIREMQAETYTK